MAGINAGSYPYQVKLLDLYKGKDQDPNNPKKIRLYETPTNMTQFKGSAVPPPQKVIDLAKYGISDRRTEINSTLEKRSSQFSQRQFVDLLRHERSPFPNFIGNAKMFKSILTPNLSSRIFQATYLVSKDQDHPGKWSTLLKLFGDSGGESDPKETIGFGVEQDTSTTFKIVEKETMHGIFAAKLDKRTNVDNAKRNLDEIKMTITAELEGFQYTEDRETRMNSVGGFQFTPEETKSSIVEVKSIDTASFYPRAANDMDNKWYYEENTLRWLWGHARLLGLENILCGIVEVDENPSSPKIKEIWNLNVKKIPQTLQDARTSTDKWKRCFPRSVLTMSKSLGVTQDACPNPWTEKSCFKKFHKALHVVKTEMSSSKIESGQTVYFVLDKKGNMTKVPDDKKKEVERINYSLMVQIQDETWGKVITEDRRKLIKSRIIATFITKAKRNKRFRFLKDWSDADMKKLTSKCSFTANIKLMFRNAEEVKEVLTILNDKFVIKGYKIKKIFEAKTATTINQLLI